MGVQRAAVLIAAALALVAVAGCVQGGQEEVKRPPEKNPEWSVTLPAAWGTVSAAQVIGDLVVVRTYKGVGILDRRSGATRSWLGGWGMFDALFVARGGGIQLTETDQRSVVRVFDLLTGRQRYEHVAARHGFVSVDPPYSSGAAVVTPTGPVVADCVDDRGGGCTIARLDLTTGQPVWQRKFPGYVSLKATGGSHLVTRYQPYGPAVDELTLPFQAPEVNTVLVTVTPLGEGAFTTSLDAATGRTLGTLPAIARNLWTEVVADGRYLVWDVDSKACAQSVTANDVSSGAVAWRTVVGNPDYEAKCRPQLWRPVVVDGQLLAMTVDRRPEVVDLSTGKASWTGEAGWDLIGVGAGIAVLRPYGGKPELTAVDVATNRKVWTRKLIKEPLCCRYGLAGGQLAFTDWAWLIVVDLHSGQQWSVAGDNSANTLLGMGPDWMLAGDPGTFPDLQPPVVRLFAW